ncbi:MAG: Hint domain-containing protein [Rhizomicrobium sp.]
MSDDVKIDRCRRNLLKAAGIAGAVLVSSVAMTSPALADNHGGGGDGGGQWWSGGGGGDGGDGGDGGGGGGGDGGCFLSGTRIRTTDGYRAIETLSPGDMVAARFGGFAAIKAVGSFSLTTAGAAHVGLVHLRPVWVRRGALADNVPSADLCLTASHAVYVDGYLVPIGQLVNGTTIVFDTAVRSQPLRFFHIELDGHDVLDANGAPCESLRAPAIQSCAPMLSFNGAQSELKSRLRSATSILIDRRQPIDVIRDGIEERALNLARAA